VAKIISDTGPLNYLVQIDQVMLLPTLFGAVTVPEVVLTELDHPGSPPAVRRWLASRPPWLIVEPDPEGRDERLSSLHDGERGTILMAMSSKADLVLMDDRAGVAAARSLGLVVTGTLGILVLAGRRGLIELADAFLQLRSTNFRFHPELLERLLARHGS